MAPDHFRHLLPCDPPADENLVYFPYWRFKGMLFSSLASGIRSKFIDVSRQAVESAHFPISMGLRSQALKLRFVTQAASGRFIAPSVSLEDAIDALGSQFCGTLSRPILYQTHVGETTSLLYAPYYLRRGRLHDAILNSPVPSSGLEALDLDSFGSDAGAGSLLFISALCPHCGWDLDGSPDSLVLHCRNCTSAWYPVGRELRPLKFGVIRSDGADILYLPFWRIRADMTGIRLGSYADLVRVANLPRAVQPGDDGEGFRFWVPAFKVRPKVFMRLAESMTLGRPIGDLSPELPAAPHHAVTLPVTEALDFLKIVLASFFKPRQNLSEILPQVSAKARSFTLVYVPFREGHHEYIQTDHEFAVNKNMLSLSRNL